MTPKIVDKEERQRQIALAAIEVLSEKGFDATSMSDVAKAAGIGKGTVYEYYSSKDELVIAALETWITALEAGAESLIDASASPETQLRELVRVFTDGFLYDPKAMKLMIGFLQVFAADPDRIAEANLADRYFSSARKGICRLLLDGVSRGTFRREVASNAERIAINLLAYLDGIGLHYFMGPKFVDIHGQIDFYMDNLLRAISVPDEE